MSKKYSILLGIGALVIMVALNVGHAIDKYGILKGNLSIHVLAQDSSSGGDSSSGSGSSGGGSVVEIPCYTVTTTTTKRMPCFYGIGFKETGSSSWGCKNYGKGGHCESGLSNWETDCYGSYIVYNYTTADLSFTCIL